MDTNKHKNKKKWNLGQIALALIITGATILSLILIIYVAIYAGLVKAGIVVGGLLILIGMLLGMYCDFNR